jgi:uncharacterized protein (DUF1684 family)
MRIPIMILLLILTAGAVLAANKNHDQEIAEFREQREASLRSETGWLTIAGFYWLKPGENPFGSRSHSTILLPEGAPAHAGVFSLQDGKVTVSLESGIEATLNDTLLVGQHDMAPDVSGAPDMLKIGRLTIWVIERNNKQGIRMRDPEFALRKEFEGVAAYPTNQDYQVKGAFASVTTPETMTVGNTLGYESEQPVQGRVAFELDGKTHTLTPFQDSPQDSVLFFVFADQTTGEETYGSGRFLYADLEEDGTVMLDFNKAYNPPCAFNPFTTCPLPPDENRLPVAIRSGEKDYRPTKDH